MMTTYSRMAALTAGGVIYQHIGGRGHVLWSVCGLFGLMCVMACWWGYES